MNNNSCKTFISLISCAEYLFILWLLCRVPLFSLTFVQSISFFSELCAEYLFFLWILCRVSIFFFELLCKVSFSESLFHMDKRRIESKYRAFGCKMTDALILVCAYMIVTKSISDERYRHRKWNIFRKLINREQKTNLNIPWLKLRQMIDVRSWILRCVHFSSSRYSKKKSHN